MQMHGANKLMDVTELFEIKQRKNRGLFFFGSKERFRVTAHLKDKELNKRAV